MKRHHIVRFGFAFLLTITTLPTAKTQSLFPRGEVQQGVVIEDPARQTDNPSAPSTNEPSAGVAAPMTLPTSEPVPVITPLPFVENPAETITITDEIATSYPVQAELFVDSTHVRVGKQIKVSLVVSATEDFTNATVTAHIATRAANRMR